MAGPTIAEPDCATTVTAPAVSLIELRVELRLVRGRLGPLPRLASRCGRTLGSSRTKAALVRLRFTNTGTVEATFR